MHELMHCRMSCGLTTPRAAPAAVVACACASLISRLFPRPTTSTGRSAGCHAPRRPMCFHGRASSRRAAHMIPRGRRLSREEGWAIGRAIETLQARKPQVVLAVCPRDSCALQSPRRAHSARHGRHALRACACPRLHRTAQSQHRQRGSISIVVEERPPHTAPPRATRMSPPPSWPDGVCQRLHHPTSTSVVLPFVARLLWGQCRFGPRAEARARGCQQSPKQPPPA
eukprot:scaffold290043_cov33-Tisochrysis_lutea.AAC.3